MTEIASALSAANAAVFAKLGLDSKHAEVRRSDRPEIADFQCNGAMAAAKAAGKKPQELAGEIAAAWEATALAPTPQVAGPGFLNFTVSAAALSARARAIAEDARAGASLVERKRRVIVDYGG
ncbi:MAG TPA: arginine--tRNA ligase, partial [Hyphomonadaceae bacterium]|nr:arginine--tRNA ligase [Hyphomonadaceae bacterium]